MGGRSGFPVATGRAEGLVPGPRLVIIVALEVLRSLDFAAQVTHYETLETDLIEESTRVVSHCSM